MSENKNYMEELLKANSSTIAESLGAETSMTEASATEPPVVEEPIAKSSVVESPVVKPVVEKQVTFEQPQVEAPKETQQERSFVEKGFPQMEFMKVTPSANESTMSASETEPTISGVAEPITPKVEATPTMAETVTPTTPKVEETPTMVEPETTPKISEYIAPQARTYDTYQFSQGAPATPRSMASPKTSKKKASKETGGIGKKFALCTALALVFGLVAGAVFQGINMLGNNYLGNQTQESVALIPETNMTVDGDIRETLNVTPETVTEVGNVAEVAEKVMPSVVAISNIAVQEVPSFFGQSYENESSGSGIIVGQNDTELLIATNNHVVSGATTITVTFIDNSSVEAQIKGTDADNDLAVVAVNVADIQEATLAEIKVATIGDSDQLKVCEQVVAIGNALGYGQSVTSGYVSALDREVDVDATYTAKLIQTDAAINPGNSGGALLNMQGELIGINAVKFAANGVEGMGYAIPVSTAEPILGELMNRTTRYKVESEKASYLGVSCRAVTAETAEMYNMPVGVFVADVTSGAPAEKAGIQKGDIIVKFDGQSVKTYDELVNALTYYEAGETVDVVVARAEAGEYKEQTMPVVLEARPADLDAQNRQGGNQENNQFGEDGGNFQLPW